MKNLGPEQQAFAILNEFHPDDLAMIFNHTQEMRTLLQLTQDPIEDSDIITKNLVAMDEEKRGTTIVLLSIYLQRISCQHARKFKKIAQQFSQFEAICEKMAKEIEYQQES